MFSRLFSGWGAQTPDKGEAPKKGASEVIDQNFGHQETLEDKADQAKHRAQKCLHEAALRKQKGDNKGYEIHKKRAIMYRKQEATFRQQANNLIQQGIVLEEASSNAAVHETMQDSLRTGQSLLKTIDVDDVAETADDWAELYADSREVGRAMSAPLSLGSLSDGEEEDVLDAEIAQLMEAQSLKTAEEVALPSVPQKIPTAAEGGNNSPGGGGGGQLKVTRANSMLTT